MGEVWKSAARRRSAEPDGPATGTRRVVGEREAPLVLLVDDVEDERDMYAVCFEAAGLRVEHAVDGDHAFFKVLALVPDVVVMDLGMPGVDGWEATRLIKHHPRTRHIPVIVLTGQVAADQLRRAHEAGGDAVLTKPCSPNQLLVLVRELLAR